jgi:MoxR-like ATPase
MRIELGYPDTDAERALLQGQDRRDLLETLEPCMDVKTLIDLQIRTRQVYSSNALLDYLQELVNHTRRSADYVNGLSPRAALALLHAARAWTLMDGREHVVPEDVQAVLPGVVGHRLISAGQVTRANGVDIAQRLIGQVPIP